MASSGMLRCVALVGTDVSEELSSSFIWVTRIGELGTTLAVTSKLRSVHRLRVTASVVPSSPILVTLMKEELTSSEMSILTRATRRNIPEDTILHVWVSTACYGDSFTILYVDDVCTSQEAWTTTVHYGDSFTFLICRRCSYLTGITSMGLHGLLRREL
jgi:hypothetical protein